MVDVRVQPIRASKISANIWLTIQEGCAIVVVVDRVSSVIGYNKEDDYGCASESKNIRTATNADIED